MGLFGTLIGFGAGYVAGMKFGDRPVTMVRSTVEQGKAKAETLASGAQALRGDDRQVRDVMTAAPEIRTPETPLTEVAKVMDRSEIGDVLVVDDSQRLLGIVTDRDIAVRALAADRDPASTPVRDVMSSANATIEPTATVDEALEQMRLHDVRRLPVVVDGKPIGIVSIGDLSTHAQAGHALADISTAQPNN